MKNLNLSQNTIIQIEPPPLFSFKECLHFLDRGFDDCMFSVRENSVLKLLELQQRHILIAVSCEKNQIIIRFLNGQVTEIIGEETKAYIADWFDLDRDISPFYHLAEKDKILNDLVKKYQGLRLIAIPDLFEALCWAIIGQQINLTFAYQIKRQLVEKYGESCIYQGHTFYLFPKPEKLAFLGIEELKKMQFSTQKANYVIELANHFLKATISKDILMKESNLEAVIQKLTALKGIGQWTAHYAAMKCLKFAHAFPAEDAGLKNALKNLLKSNKNPSLSEIRQIAKHWKGWESYATLYVWRSLAKN